MAPGPAASRASKERAAAAAGGGGERPAATGAPAAASSAGASKPAGRMPAPSSSKARGAPPTSGAGQVRDLTAQNTELRLAVERTVRSVLQLEGPRVHRAWGGAS